METETAQAESIQTVLNNLSSQYGNAELYYNADDETDEEKQCIERCRYLNERQGYLNDNGYHCDICNDEGVVFKPVKRGGTWTKAILECKCMNTRLILRKLARSGLENIILKYKFENFFMTEDWQKNMYQKAVEAAETGHWFFIGGQSGCGKTHICTAICNKMLKLNKTVKYMLWVGDAKQLKATVNDVQAHTSLINEYKTADVLYIDDFFKTGKDKDGFVQPPTAADIQLAYDIINYRYNNSKLMTIISSERYITAIDGIDESTFTNIETIDEAIFGRIAERTGYGKFTVNIKPDRNRNYRARNISGI